MSYRTPEEMAYYNSDISKFIGKNCAKIMTSIDADLLQYKASRSMIRLAEYKHGYETVGEKQRGLLKNMARIFRFLNDGKKVGITFECGVVRGDPPFDHIEFEDFIYDKKYTYSGEDVKTFLTLEHPWREDV